MRHRICVLMIFAFTRLTAQQADQYAFQHIDQSDGLLHNNVLDMLQDARGFIWVRTPNGLQRYDGSRFVNYQSILDNPVTGPVAGGELYFDSARNEIWLDATGQMQKLSLATNQFTTYSWTQLADAGEKEEIFYDGDSTIWRLRSAGYFQRGVSINFLFPFFHARFKQRGESGSIARDSAKRQFWMTAGDGLLLVDASTHRMYSSKFNPLHHPLLDAFGKTGQSPRYIMIDRHDNIWITCWNDQFFRYDPVRKQLNDYSLAGIKGKQSESDRVTETQLVNKIFEDHSGTIWIATENAGLLRFVPETNGFETIDVDARDRNVLQYNYRIYSILQDREENLWIGTDRGISIFNPSRQFFHSVRHKDNQPSMPRAEIDRIHQCVNGDILVGFWGAGFSVYDSLWNFRRNVVVPGALDYNLIWCFSEEDDGTVWIGCQHGNLHKYNPRTGSLITLRPPEMKASTIRCMTRDRAGNFWFGLHNGQITEWNRKENRFYPYDSGGAKLPPMPPVVSLFIDARGMCWVSTENGFKKFDLAKRMYTRTYLPDSSNPHAISATSIQSVAALDDSTLMIGTTFGGINVFSTNHDSFTHIGMADGLPSNTVYSLKKNSDGYVWFTTDYNLYKFRPGTRNFIRYNFYPGTVNSTFLPDGFYPLRDGSWATASAAEVIAFQPEADSVKHEHEAVNISGLRIYDSLIFIDSFLFQHKPIRLNSHQNFLTFQYASLHFSRLHQTKYYYKLSGVNEDWVSAGNRNIASYTNLGPGKYLFSVKTDQDGQTSPFSSIEVVILPAFWQTWWFRTLLLLLGVVLIWWLIRRRVKTIRFEAELQQKMIESKMIALRAQMNPHFIFNCLNSIDNLIQLDEKEKATLYLSKFARLIRATLEHSEQSAVPCWKDMETLELYLELESLRFDNKFSWKLKVSREILQGDYKVPPLIIQPFVENAIHHGLLNKIDENKQLLVEVSAHGGQIHFVIEDNGVGRARAKTYQEINAASHESMGLRITRDRIHLFNRSDHDSVTITDLVNERMEPVGTKVNIELQNLS